MAENPPLPTLPPNVTVTLDETGDYPMLTIVMPKGTRLPYVFVHACHETAGRHGSGIQFLERA